MKAKQLVGIIVTGITIIAVGVTGVVGNIIQNKSVEQTETQSIFSSFEELSAEVELPMEDFIGVINVVGEIGPSTEDVFSTTSGGYNHTLYMDYANKIFHRKFYFRG